jgi:CO/xanthine dehydrogenase Mo-binding subunit
VHLDVAIDRVDSQNRVMPDVRTMEPQVLNHVVLDSSTRVNVPAAHGAPQSLRDQMLAILVIELETLHAFSSLGARGFLGAFGSAPICAAYVLAV